MLITPNGQDKCLGHLPAAVTKTRFSPWPSGKDIHNLSHDKVEHKNASHQMLSQHGSWPSWISSDNQGLLRAYHLSKHHPFQGFWIEQVLTQLEVFVDNSGEKRRCSTRKALSFATTTLIVIPVLLAGAFKDGGISEWTISIRKLYP